MPPKAADFLRSLLLVFTVCLFVCFFFHLRSQLSWLANLVTSYFPIACYFQLSHFSSSFITNKEKSLQRALFFYCLGVGPGHFLLQRNVALLPRLVTWLSKSGSQNRTINLNGEVVRHKNGRCCVRKTHNTLESFASFDVFLDGVFWVYAVSRISGSCRVIKK